MASWIKYTIIGVFFFTVILWIANVGIRHSSNVTATQEIQVGAKSAQVGEMRVNATNVLDKKALVANLILEVAKTHKEQGKDVKVDYVFLDENGNVTTEDNKIKGVQFKVSILDKNGKVLSTSTERVSLEKDE